MPIALRMPALSPTMKVGTLARWCVKVGEKVDAGTLLAEIETDKAVMEYESADNGTVARLLVAEGTKNVSVNTPIALLLEEGEGDDAVEQFLKEQQQEKPQELASEGKDENGAKQERPVPATPSKVANEESAAPSLAKTNTNTNASAKQSANLSASPPHASPPHASPPYASPLARRIAERDKVSLTGVMGTGAHGKIVAADVSSPIDGAGGYERAARVFASPRARSRARESGIAIAELRGSGPEGRIVLADVERVIGGGTGALPDFSEIPLETPFELREHSSMRSVIAERLSLSKSTIPHFYLTVSCRLDSLLLLREHINHHYEHLHKANSSRPFRVSLNDLLVKGLALALNDCRDANVAWGEEGLKQFLRVDVAVAVAVAGGLLTPIIRDAAAKPFDVVSSELRSMITRAREGSLQPHEYSGGTITISNLGMYGISNFQAVINPPQAAIFAIGAAEDVLVRDKLNGTIVSEKRVNVTLSADHRAIDGAIGAQLCASFKNIIEHPISIILS